MDTNSDEECETEKDRRKKDKNSNIIACLRTREIYGTFSRQKPFIENKGKFLFPTAPKHLQFHLASVFDSPFQEVFMGLTQCGTFMITYNFVFTYRYVLRFWLFTPGKRAVMVKKVTLFDGFVSELLTIQIFQWPGVPDKVLVYGYAGNFDRNNQNCTARAYITITSLPPRQFCVDCYNIKMAPKKDNSGGRGSEPVDKVEKHCLKHGFAVHMHLDATTLYPWNESNMFVGLNNSFGINTGSFLHIFTVNLKSTDQNSVLNSTSTLKSEYNKNIGKKLLSQGWGYKIPPAVTLENVACSLVGNVSSYPRYTISHSLPPIKKGKYGNKPEQVYDFADTDDGFDLKYKWYRKKELADKMYEYSSDNEDNTENVRPARRKAPPRGFAPIMRTRLTRILMNRRQEKMGSPLRRNIRLRDLVREQLVTPREKRLPEYIRLKISSCSARFHKMFVQNKGDLNKCNGGPTHRKLTREDEEASEVHGAVPLSVRDGRGKRLKFVPKVEIGKQKEHYCTVDQISLDIEDLCYKLSDQICKFEGYKFWFCSNYSMEILQVCPVTGEILAVVFMNINAELEDKNAGRERKFYELHCVFSWDPELDNFLLEAYYPLIKVMESGTSWYPNVKIIRSLRDSLVGDSKIPVVTPVRQSSHNYDVPWDESLSVISDDRNAVMFYRDAR